MPVHTKEKALTQRWEQQGTGWAALAAWQKAFWSSAEPLDTAISAQEINWKNNTFQWKTPNLQSAAAVAMRAKHRN